MKALEKSRGLACVCCLGVVLLAMAGASAQDARVRVVHASPDAPAVDVCANGATLFAGAAFGAISGYATVPEATYDINVIAAGGDCALPGVISASLPLAGDTTVVALNLLSSIEPLVLADDNTPPALGNAKVRFVHASPDAPAVDIAVAGSAPDSPLFDDISFKGIGGYSQVPAGSYDLEVRTADGLAVVLTLPGVALAEGGIYTVYAIGLLAGDPALGAAISVDNQARVRVVHASPDAPAVDVCVNGAAAFTALAFNQGTAYAPLFEAVYNVKIVPAGAGCASAGVIEAGLSVGGDLTVAAVNTLSGIEPLVLLDDNTPPAPGNVRVRFVHASPDAPAVDIAVAGSDPGSPLFDDVAFKGITGYLEVPAGSYPLEVRTADGATTVLPLGAVTLLPGTVYTVFATGLLAGSPALGALILVDVPGGAPHSADVNGNNRFELSELLRVVQFFNLGGYGCAVGVASEDGYEALGGDQTCSPHSSDYVPQDWSMDLGEILRLVQLYNAGAYYACADFADTEDGFCPGLP